MRTKMFLICVFLLFCSATQAQQQTIAPSAGKGLCSALTPADFLKAGIPAVTPREANVDDKASTYCVFDSKEGKVEFDIFFPAGDNNEVAKGTEKTVLAEVGGKFEAIQVAGADSAEINLNVPGKTPSASIAVRKGAAVFTLNIPTSQRARQQLLTLAQTVLTRLQH